MSNVNNIEFKILITLFRARGKLDSFSAFNRVKIPFPDFNQAVKRLEKIDFLHSKEFIIELTIEGKDFILKNSSNYGGRKKVWRNIPPDFISPKLNPEIKYVPSISLLDRDIFPIHRKYRVKKVIDIQ
ncbi:Uncharacterised protein [Yersinia intermedia]|uniref:Uncharacterized protein n=1 Tax=Yersinia intermedia TaxID=631 RepID=A0A0H5LRK7_YERIN|nr:hypothetical protein [Yersinia intermedia]CRY53704.1 Uncharacterised protein [Yersinia intermedia]